jgi:hypothetical protein
MGSVEQKKLMAFLMVSFRLDTSSPTLYHHGFLGVMMVSKTHNCMFFK